MGANMKRLSFFGEIIFFRCSYRALLDSHPSINRLPHTRPNVEASCPGLNFTLRIWFQKASLFYKQKNPYLYNGLAFWNKEMVKFLLDWL